MSSQQEQQYDLIVIGAGWYGLAAAKTYMELHPLQRVLVLERNSTCGGTWSRDRLYPGLRSNNLLGSYEYPDFPMCGARYGVRDGEHIPGEVLHRYLTDFAAAHGVLERTRFGVRVDALEAAGEDGWRVHVSTVGAAAAAATAEEEEEEKQTASTAGGSEAVLVAKRIIIATGTTSQPSMPYFAGQETFTAALFHAAEFGQRSEALRSCKRVVVVGGSKSAFDCAYGLATGPEPCRVELVVRATGNGPAWLCPAYVTPLRFKAEELMHMRLMAWLSPCPWGAEDGSGRLRQLLHGTRAGRLLTRTFWAALGADVVRVHGYRRDAELRKLEPRHSTFWYGPAIGIDNYPGDLRGLVRSGAICVHVADVTGLRGRDVRLSDGTLLDAVDAVVCATGWRKQFPLRPPQSAEETSEELAAAAAAADAAILTSFPELGGPHRPLPRTADRDQPPRPGPARNYRFMVPADTAHLARRNVAVAGMISSVSTSLCAAVQALWISAFFDGKLRRPPPGDPDQLTSEVMLHTQFGRWRYPCGTRGDEAPDLAFESLPYLDLLLNDLGLRVWRKTSWLRELVGVYKPRDYAGLTGEWAGLVDRAQAGSSESGVSDTRVFGNVIVKQD